MVVKSGGAALRKQESKVPDPTSHVQGKVRRPSWQERGGGVGRETRQSSKG